MSATVRRACAFAGGVGMVGRVAIASKRLTKTQPVNARIASSAMTYASLSPHGMLYQFWVHQSCLARARNRCVNRSSSSSLWGMPSSLSGPC